LHVNSLKFELHLVDFRNWTFKSWKFSYLPLFSAFLYISN